MGWLSQYVLCIGTGAILVAIISDLTNSGTGPGTLLRVVAGLFLLVQLLGPRPELNVDSWSDYLTNVSYQGDIASREGTELASAQLEDIIKQKTSSYILDIAESYHADLDVVVELDDSAIPVPVAVRLTGAISPYAKGRLQQTIAADLNIPEDQQIWKGN